MSAINQRKSSENNTDSTSYFANTFETQELLGKGGFGEVYQVYNKTDKQLYAVKKIKINREIDVQNEVIILSKLNHHNIVRYYHAWVEEADPEIDVGSQLVTQRDSQQAVDAPKSDTSLFSNWQRNDMNEIKREELDKDNCSSSFINFKDSGQEECDKENNQSSSVNDIQKTPEKVNLPKPLKFFYVQMELCLPKTLKDWLEDPEFKIRDKHRAALVCNYIVDALSYIHTRKPPLIHRDLKPGNIFLTGSMENFVPKLGDFGLAKIVEHPEKDSIVSPSSTKGTSFYISPEMRQRKEYNHTTDIFSLGIIYFELLVYFSTAYERCDVLRKISETSQLPDNYPNLDQECTKTLISKMISTDWKSRPNAPEVSLKLVRFRGYLTDLRDQENSNNMLTEDHWWDWEVGAVAGKKPKVKPAIVVDCKKVFLNSDTFCEEDLKSNLNVEINLCNKLGLINHSFKLLNSLPEINSLSKLFLFGNVNLDRNGLSLINSLSTLKAFHCFQIMPNDLCLDLNSLNASLKEIYFRGMKIDISNEKLPLNLETLALVECRVNSNLVTNCSTLLPNVQEICLLSCRTTGSLPKLSPLLTNTSLDAFLPCPKLTTLTVSFVIMFGDTCKLGKTQFFHLTKAPNEQWENRHIKHSEHVWFFSKYFCYDEVLSPDGDSLYPDDQLEVV